jgi:Ni/Co efflux regulator RcnB
MYRKPIGRLMLTSVLALGGLAAEADAWEGERGSGRPGYAEQWGRSDSDMRNGYREGRGERREPAQRRGEGPRYGDYQRRGGYEAYGPGPGYGRHYPSRRYHAPPPPHWARGQRYYGPVYVINDYPRHHLRHPPYGHRWQRDDAGNLLLIAITTGIIADIVLHH